MIYPTIVCLAVHTYFLVCVIARQYVEGSKYESDMVGQIYGSIILQMSLPLGEAYLFCLIIQ